MFYGQDGQEVFVSFPLIIPLARMQRISITDRQILNLPVTPFNFRTQHFTFNSACTEASRQPLGIKKGHIDAHPVRGDGTCMAQCDAVPSASMTPKHL
jgi:hypothetical protein